MIEFASSFRQLEHGDGYRAVISGSLLRKAQEKAVHLQVENPAGEYEVDLSTVGWYDENTVSGHKEGKYGSIRKVRFDETAEYAVFFITKVLTPYMLAIRMPS